jgi:hypothetical protein
MQTRESSPTRQAVARSRSRCPHSGAAGCEQPAGFGAADRSRRGRTAGRRGAWRSGPAGPGGVPGGGVGKARSMSGPPPSRHLPGPHHQRPGHHIDDTETGGLTVEVAITGTREIAPTGLGWPAGAVLLGHGYVASVRVTLASHRLRKWRPGLVVGREGRGGHDPRPSRDHGLPGRAAARNAGGFH